jgi:hypothetical protein
MLGPSNVLLRAINYHHTLIIAIELSKQELGIGKRK